MVAPLRGPQEALVQSSVSHKLCGEQAYVPRTQEMEVGESEAQGNPQLSSEFEASPEYIRPYLKRKTKRMDPICEG